MLFQLYIYIRILFFSQRLDLKKEKKEKRNSQVKTPVNYCMKVKKKNCSYLKKGILSNGINSNNISDTIMKLDK